MKKYFEYTDAVSNKFWEINLKGKQVTLTYGRIGIKKPAQIDSEIMRGRTIENLELFIYIIYVNHF